MEISLHTMTQSLDSLPLRLRNHLLLILVIHQNIAMQQQLQQLLLLLNFSIKYQLPHIA